MTKRRSHVATWFEKLLGIHVEPDDLDPAPELLEVSGVHRGRTWNTGKRGPRGKGDPRVRLDRH